MIRRQYRQTEPKRNGTGRNAWRFLAVSDTSKISNDGGRSKYKKMEVANSTGRRWRGSYWRLTSSRNMFSCSTASTAFRFNSSTLEQIEQLESVPEPRSVWVHGINLAGKRSLCSPLCALDMGWLKTGPTPEFDLCCTCHMSTKQFKSKFTKYCQSMVLGLWYQRLLSTTIHT